MVHKKFQKQELSKKYFTLEDAERLIPQINKILRRTITLDKALDLLSSIEIEVYDEDYDNLRRVTKLNKEFHRLSYEFYANIDKMEELGCVIVDLEIGVIDFYSNYNGKDIFLCWKLGEKSIKYWHDLGGCYMGRKPLMDLRKTSQ
ncbi:DUF2203 domain-containing protein [Candidatus Woesearchaeota archaeon]|nr:DUF2203 domain-containing protein [Candidatus Woesearchaeota archaeon]